MDAQDINMLAGAIGALGAAVVGVMYRGARARSEHEAETSALKRAVKERDVALAELEQSQAAQRQAAAGLARAEAEKEALRREVLQLGDEFGAFQRKIARMFPETAGFMDSDVMPWTEHNK